MKDRERQHPTVKHWVNIIKNFTLLLLCKGWWVWAQKQKEKNEVEEQNLESNRKWVAIQQIASRFMQPNKLSARNNIHLELPGLNKMIHSPVETSSDWVDVCCSRYGKWQVSRLDGMPHSFISTVGNHDVNGGLIANSVRTILNMGMIDHYQLSKQK